MRKFLDRLYALSGYMAAFCIMAICAMVFLQVIFNIIDKVSVKLTGEVVGLAIPSYTEFAGFLLTGASFLALAYTFKKGGHIRVTLILQTLPKRVQKLLNILALFLCGMMALYASYFCVALTYESFVYNDLSAGIIAIPLWIPQMFMTAGFLIFAIALWDELINLFLYKDKM